MAASLVKDRGAPHGEHSRSPDQTTSAEGSTQDSFDHLSTEARSRLMSRIRGANTKPEIFVRRMLHRAGFRYRLGGAGLPGRPDIVLPRYRAVIFVNGCFWHRHDCPKGRSLPKTNADFWRSKLARNQERDHAIIEELKRLGWRVLVVWECELRHPDMVLDRLKEELQS